MKFANFTTLVRDEVKKTIGNGCRLRLNDVQKNNGIVLTGLTMMQDDRNISPTIYLNHYYEDYVSGKTTLVNIINDVRDTCKRNEVYHCEDMSYFLDYESVKPRVVYKLISTEKNKKLLEDIPHKNFLDLSIVFQCMVSQEKLGIASILIHNAHQKMWNISVEDLYQAAKENTPKLLGCKIKHMTEILCEVVEEDYLEVFNRDDNMESSANNIPMYVLSNNSGVEGAACMLYPDVISNFANAIKSSLYIIPSSIHELLLLPTENDERIVEIKNMIKEINDTQVSATEVLSYSLYYYDRKKDRIVRL